MNDTHPLFRELSRETFLAEYWQQKPCLFRSVWVDGLGGPDLDELAGLAMEPEIESRLIRENTRYPMRDARHWHLEHGPFPESTLTRLPDRHWTLLVQALDQWLPEVHSAFAAIDFLPAWRRDDIMLSGSAPGGTVGPHFDHYDVFLYQAKGQRRWQVGPGVSPQTAVVEDAPLNLLAEFEPLPGHDWLLEPGDVLYIPPLYGHFGVAETAGITWSFGFRSPDAIELLQGLASRLAIEPASDFLRYADANLSMAEAARNTLTPEALQRAKALVNRVLEDDSALADWLGSFMTASKYDLFQSPETGSGADAFSDLAPDTWVRLALPTRCTAYQNRLYTNGRIWELESRDQAFIDALTEQAGPWPALSLSGMAQSVAAQRALNWLWQSGSLEAAEDDDALSEA